MRCTFPSIVALLMLFATAAFVSLAARAESTSQSNVTDPFALPMAKVTLVKESNVAGRKVVRYEHDSLPEWKYAKSQRDNFHVVFPKGPTTGKTPLMVILHSAGGSGESEMFPGLKNGTCVQARADDSFYGLYLDCRANKELDWWWGYQAIKKTPDPYKNELYPTERRLLATVAASL